MGFDADWSVELGADDPVLEFPWTSSDPLLTYVDLKRQPERLDQVAEIAARPELAEFLKTVNSPESSLISAKCDVWSEDELGAAEDIYQASSKFCSYVDLLLMDETARASFAANEALAKRLARFVEDLGDSVEGSAAAEFIVRRCWFHAKSSAASSEHNSGKIAHDELAEGFYITFYLFGYGGDEAEARLAWAQGLLGVTAVLAHLVA
jgi:hypothetical protein